jgi:hypothetical protein
MDARARVRHAIDALRAKVDAEGAIRDPALLEQVRAVHSEQASPPRLRIAPPAEPTALEALSSEVKRRFQVPLPTEYRSFLEACDGLALSFAPPDEPATFARDAVMSARAISSWMAAHRIEAQLRDRVREDYPLFVPFFVLGDFGWHAFDYNAQPSEAPVVVDISPDFLWSLEGGYEPLHASFAEWLDAFIESGFAPSRCGTCTGRRA